VKRVVVGLSGGVDSSVAAYLLLEQGYEVIGMFMKNWHDESVTLSDECPWIDDSNDALLVAQHLGIPFQVIDLSKEYKERIVDYMFKEYESGRTPNPDVLCNREIKFDAFLKAATDLGADYVATGHYCRKLVHENGITSLLSGKDKNKDQSYFLCQINREQLSKALFPIGDLEKSVVRRIAAEQGLVTAEKKDSQGLCFVGKISLPIFLQQQLQQKLGPIIEIPEDNGVLNAYHQLTKSENNLVQLSEPFKFNREDGIQVGEHQGAHYYTIGQRKGLHIGGRPEPSFVIGIDTNENVIYTGQTVSHPGLNRSVLKLELSQMNWLNAAYELVEDGDLEVMSRIRYRQPLQKAKLIRKSNEFYLLFNQPQKGITPGQFAVWYIADELIGSSVIYS
jgi:tRNA-specific 2-thiouridylase